MTHENGEDHKGVGYEPTPGTRAHEAQRRDQSRLLGATEMTGGLVRRIEKLEQARGAAEPWSVVIHTGVDRGDGQAYVALRLPRGNEVPLKWMTPEMARARGLL